MQEQDNVNWDNVKLELTVFKKEYSTIIFI